jgi:EAL domain-containing protein (putative c-di-GMP-specific phosphodiesterase class I)
MAIMAEDVERPEQLARSREEGCTELHGYLLNVTRSARESPGPLKHFHPSKPLAA